MTTTRVPVLLGILASLALCLNSGYLVAEARPSLLYLSQVLIHTIGGVILLPLLVCAAWRLRAWCQTHASKRCAALATVGWWCLLLGSFAGMSLIAIGNYRPQRWLLYGHIGLCSSAVLLFIAALVAKRRTWTWRAAVLITSTALLLPLMLLGLRMAQPDPYVVANPLLPPLSQDDEGMGGKHGPFHPSGISTNTGGTIPSNFFLTSKRCADCHPDIYRQWSESAHRFSSFNNQWYRKSIEYMQDVLGTRPTRWCAGCHDVALLLNGMMDTPVRQLLETPEAHVGLACTACHAITHVQDTMGNGDYRITYPALHDLMASDNPVFHWLHDFIVRVDPAPHRHVFLKPFHHNAQSAAFCSSCHKVHLDTHVNNYRWFRGFNEYDAWQASGVSGYGARSFYYPDRPRTCTDCHMPLIPSDDLGHKGGLVHNHRFPAANTALPTANKHPEQLAVTTAFLQQGVVTVDIFGMSPAPPLTQPPPAAAESAKAYVATLASGEEEAGSIGQRQGRAPQARPLLAPLDAISATVQRGTDVLIDVVVRNRGVGHFFPGGTVDAFDVWVELKAVDNHGQVLFWSGAVADGGRGPVAPDTHRYGSFLVDAHGNAINKRNAWAARAVVYAQAIPPGAADVVHYRLAIPESAGDRLTLTAQLHYRKFRWWHTQWAYAGVRDPQQPAPDITPHYDDGSWVFTGDTSTVSGATKAIPDLPIVTMAQATADLRVVAPNTALPTPQVHTTTGHRERWNDYGIGLLLQGDLRGAAAAFAQVTRLEPTYVDGWVNLGRARLQDGDPVGAEAALTHALKLAPELPRTHFFLAMVRKADGQYEAALVHLRRVTAAYPTDRVVQNQIGRLLFLLGNYAEARQELERVLRIDPENLQAHYNLMLCLRALGDTERAETHRQLYQRFKADESAQVIAGIARRRYPEANRESLPVHEHQSMSLPPAPHFTSPTLRTYP